MDLNDGRAMRFNVRDASLSCLDLTLVSGSLAGKCEWEVKGHTVIGSDHFPVLCYIEVSRDSSPASSRWCFDKADWGKINKICSEGVMNFTVVQIG